MRDWTTSLRPLPLILAIGSCATTGVVGGGLVYHWFAGGPINIVSMVGASLSVTIGASIGTLRRRRREARRPAQQP
ncbi:hypothetical protein ABH926_004624 [Catenulispora sp. GP43]|uniref:hypothetical protein n=1 Tax=Catenulispora sp. GP43 TaxID=3156263 RepID=UPI0035129D1A